MFGAVFVKKGTKKEWNSDKCKYGKVLTVVREQTLLLLGGQLEQDSCSQPSYRAQE
jgi:hypothetical protein